jgi:type IV secretion system protein VirB11
MDSPQEHVDGVDVLGIGVDGARKKIELPQAEFTGARRSSIAARTVEEALGPVETETPRKTESPPNVRPLRNLDPAQLSAKNRNDAAEPPDVEIRRRAEENLDNALGPLRRLLRKATISDILRNPDGRVFVIEHGQPKYEIKDFQMTEEQAMNLVGQVAAYMNVKLNHEHPIIQAILPGDGSRFTGTIPPVVSPGIGIAIRKHGVDKKTLDDYVEKNSLTSRQVAMLRKGFADRDNILIVGSTGSGKTTFANACLNEMAKNSSDRFVIIEDTPEIQCPADDVVKLQTTPTITMNELLRLVLRLSPDRICVGEVRGAEAHVLLKSWNTGHKGGLTTIHAGDVARGLTRLEQCIEEAGVPIVRSRIADAVQLIVVIKKNETGERRVTEIKRLIGVNGDQYRFETTNA